MKITPQQQAFWQEQYEHGDYGRIMTESGIDQRKVSETMQTGEGPEEVVDAVHKFYMDRKKKNDDRIAEMNGNSNEEARA